jgi:glucose-1-phosphate thymidylyltransferase
MTRPIGIVPAAGQGLRLRPFRYPKELLPVALTPTEDGLRPVLAVEFAMAALHTAGCRQVVTVVADHKLDLIRLLGTGEALGLGLAYVHQGAPRGLSDAVCAAAQWTRGRNVALVLPDTLFTPRDAVKQVVEELPDADLVLGLFPTDRPTHLGPVRVAQDGSVLEVLDKPAATDLDNTWGVAAWGPAFTELLTRRQEDPAHQSEAIGLAYQAAVEAGLRVRAVRFDGGKYHDIGTTRSLSELIQP